MRRPARADRDAHKPTLGARLLQHVTLPLALTWLLGAAIAVLVGDLFAQQAFDRALLDDAYVVSSHVERVANTLALSLSDEEMDVLLFDQSESQYFAVLADDGTLLAGQAGLDGAAAPADGASYAFSTIDRNGQRLRAVRLKQREGSGYAVIIAQTTQVRSDLLRRLLVYSIVPQLALLALVAWGLRSVVRRDLAPLTALQQTLDQRDAADLTPLPPALARDAGSREVERVGVAIDALLARLADGVQAQREFAGNVAHELRTPLAGIRALAEYGLAQGDARAMREQLQAIADSESRVSHLVDQLLALALADESRQSLVLVPVSLDAVAREVVLRFLPRADQRGVDLGAEGLDAGAMVCGQPALIEGALGNLIDNALRYGRADGRPPMITVGLTREGAQWRLSVADNGPGMTPSAALMQRWAQGPSGEAVGQRLGEGAGLGLAIVARYAGLLQARFELGANPGGGLSATLVFEAIAAA